MLQKIAAITWESGTLHKVTLRLACGHSMTFDTSTDRNASVFCEIVNVQQVVSCILCREQPSVEKYA